jgi:putative transposase
MSDLYQSLSHSKWDCKYHVVFVPKRRRKVIFGQTRHHLGPILHGLARQKECQILEGHLMPDHVHMCIAIPPKHPVASVIGFLKGKSGHRDSPAAWQGAEFLRRAFLGAGLCRFHRRI